MRNRTFIFLFVLIFMMVFSLSAVSADDLQTTDSGQVSGDVDVVTVNPWNTTGELTYEIPNEAKNIASADVYVNVYGGSAKNTHGANANVSLITKNGENQLGSEILWIEDGSSDGTVYTVNNHTDKCYSDYQMRYDIKDMLNGLSGSSIAIKVDTFAMENKTFDGRIKLIALVFAYDDGDSDVINYWVDSNQKWTKSNVTTVFETENAAKGTATLTNVALSSADGSFRVNNELIGDPDNHSSGNYYQYSVWDDVSSKVLTGQNTELMAVNVGTSTYASLKNVLSVLKIKAFDVEDKNYSGQVSGDVDVVTVNPWNTTGELTYEIPTDAKSIVSADVYVNVYGGSAKITHGANANVTLVTPDGLQLLGSEELWIAEGSADGKVYIVNDHTDKCYSDYQIHYDIKDLVSGLNGSSISIKVDTFAMEGKTFDGRIKLIALVLAYDDGDSDVINYWVDFNQKWTKSNVTTTFATENAAKGTATLTNVALSSADGSFRLNGELIGDPDNHSSGNYYQYSVWDDVSSKVLTGQNTELMAVNVGTSTYASLKNVLSVLKIKAFDVEDKNYSGQVSGDVDVVTVNPWNTTGELAYEIPTDAKSIVSADVFVNVYGGSAKNTYGANANVTLVTDNGESQLGSEALWIAEGSSDGTVYPVNDHTDKCYSDYQIHYDIKDLIAGLNGSSISIKVDTFAMEGKSFDGRIKLIALVLAYDDGDSDVIDYWVDFNQKWTKSNVTTTFATENAAKGTATLTNVALSSADGSFRLNNELIGDPDNHSSGNYYQYSVWDDVSSKLITGQNTELMAVNVGTSTYASLKNVLSVLKIKAFGAVENSYSGQVSGDVDVVTVNPWNTTGELTYEIPTDAKSIVSADVYVNVYGGSAKITHGANANITLVTVNGENQLGSEELWIAEGSADGKVYIVNDHIDKCYSDYQIHYDIKDLVSGLNGSSISIKVDTFAMEGKTFDGRIKLIALVLAYDDGDSDVINYWVDFNQKWTKSNVTTTFATENLTDVLKASITNVALSSADGSFRLNNELIGDPDNHSSGNYYQYSVWDDVSSKLITGQNTELMAVNVGTSTYASLKNVLSVMKTKSAIETVVTANAFFTRYDSGNAFTVTVVDADNNPVKGLQLMLKVYTGKTFKKYFVTTNDDGVASFDIASTLSIGVHDVAVSSPDQNYKVNKTYTTIQVAKAKTIVKAPAVTVKVKKSYNYKIKILNKANNKPLAKVKIKVRVLTGKTFQTLTLKTSKYGNAVFNTKYLSVGKHKVVIYTWDGRYIIGAKSVIYVKK